MANPKLSTLIDFFGAAALNATVWNNSSGLPNVSLDTSLDRVQINCTSGYPAFGGNGPWDFTSSAIYARVTPAPIGNGSTQTIMRVVVDSSNRASLFVDGGAILTATVVNAGVSTSTVIGSYNPYNHAWWRIRESSGSVMFETSPDGWTWTNRATIAHSWSAAAVSVIWICGYFGTESAGMAAYVDHVNTTVSEPDQINLNWPRVEDGWGAYWGVNAAVFPDDRFTDVSDRTRGTVDAQRGRQYELDQVRSGEASLKLANTDAALDPDNTGGPWYGHIAPFQPYRRRAQWPPTRNLLSQVQATGGDVGGYSTGALPGDAGVTGDLGGGTIAASSSAWQGARVLDFTVAAGGGAGAVIFRTRQAAVKPGVPYTHSVRVRNVATSGTIQVKPYIAWWTAGSVTPTYVDGSTVGLVGSASAAWSTLTVTATAPANAAGVEVGLRVASETPDAEVQVDGWQLERGSTATTWVCPGVWFPVYAGFVERWPSSWDMEGTYGLVQPTGVDAFALLSQVTLSDPLTEEIDGTSPSFLYKLDDPSGSTSAADATGNHAAAPVAISKYGAGSLTFGNSITATNPTTGIFTGAAGPVVTINNANPGTNTTSAASFLNLAAAGIKGPADPGLFTRFLTFRYTGPTPTAAACLWSSMDNQRSGGNPSGSRIYLYILTDGKLYFFMTDPTGATIKNTAISSVNVVDGNWHLATIGYDLSHGQVVVSLDGATTISSPATFGLQASGIVGDNLGGFVDITVGGGTTWNFKGDIAFAGEVPALLDGTQISNLYEAWRDSCVGDSTDVRYARILRYGGYTGDASIQTGLTTSMGPANISGQDVVSALQAVVETENGQHFIGRDGTPVFLARSARYNALTPAYTFGERADLGEYPYEDCELDYDPTHLADRVSVTQESTGQVFFATDAAATAAYFPRPMTRTINSTSANECQDGADYFLSRYRQPARRVSSLKLHPSANPALWPVCLNLELGKRVRVMRRPPGVPAIQVECFVENLAWEFDDDGEAWLTLQCSPADITPYAVFAAWHTTLASSIASGVSSITVNASADNVNPLATQLAAGQQLVLGQGTANAETVTVQAVGATSSGWTTATITLTAATTKSHTAGDTVCEPLPSGTTDPTTWDAVSKFDLTAFAY